MLKKIFLRMDQADPKSWTEHDEEDVRAFLFEKFNGVWPRRVRIYLKDVSKLSDVTPTDPAGVKRLGELEGPFYVVNFAGDPVTALIVFSALVFVAAYVFIPKPVIPNIGRNQSPGSPNNDLSDRSNRARPNARIPDIFGTVRSTPDLIAEPYRIYENNVEVEYSYMCIGRGSYDKEDVRDGDTLCRNIPGNTVQFFEPFTSPNSGDAPSLVVGQQRDIPVLRTKRSNSVNGQVLRPPNITTFTAVQNVRFVYPNIIELTPGSPLKFTEAFVPGDVVAVSNAAIVSGVPLTETLDCRATFVDLYQNHIGDSSPYRYECTGGALLFGISQSDVVNGLFAPGATIIITQLSYQPGHNFGVPGIDISGTYEIESVEQTEYSSGDDGLIEKGWGVPMYVIVKLVSPELVNADWEDLEFGGDAQDKRTQAGIFKLQIAHAGSAVDYDADLADTYTVVSVTDNQIVLDDPESVNADWGLLDANGGASPYLSPVIESTAAGRWVGPFIMTDAEMAKVFCNFVASNGLYKDDGTDQFAETVSIEVEVTPVDATDTQIDDAELFFIELVGSANLKEQVASTLTAQFSSFFGRCSVRARRTSQHDEEFEGQVVDEVRWKDLYSVSPISQFDFGNVTTVQAVTFATASALAVKDRRLNMQVTRRVPPRISGNIFDDANPVGTNRADAIFVAICRDRYIGNRAIEEIGVDSIFDTVQEIEDYFGTTQATEFSFTFDSSSMSFEEMLAILGQAIFSIVYRRGNVIQLSFERTQDTSVLLFNHRNKRPRTEKRTIEWGFAEENDGIELTYVNPSDDTVITVFLPEGVVTTNPRKINTVGVRQHLQAYFLVWRAWNRLRFQRIALEFEALAEAQILLRNDRILVTDGTRQEKQEGQVVAVDGLNLTLSQPVDFSLYTSYTIFLQLYDGNVESFGVTAGATPNEVVIDGAPSLPLVTADDRFVKTLYTVVGAEELGQRAFLVTERTAAVALVSTIRAINYDPRYYANDSDFINELITENGYGPTGGFVPDGEIEWPEPPSVTVQVLTAAQAVPGGPIQLNWTAVDIPEVWGEFLDYRIEVSVNGSGSVLVSGLSVLEYEDNTAYDSGDVLEYFVVSRTADNSWDSNIEEIVYATGGSSFTIQVGSAFSDTSRGFSSFSGFGSVISSDWAGVDLNTATIRTTEDILTISLNHEVLLEEVAPTEADQLFSSLTVEGIGTFNPDLATFEPASSVSSWTWSLGDAAPYFSDWTIGAEKTLTFSPP
jgi:hypothetical protein